MNQKRKKLVVRIVFYDGAASVVHRTSCVSKMWCPLSLWYRKAWNVSCGVDQWWGWRFLQEGLGDKGCNVWNNLWWFGCACDLNLCNLLIQKCWVWMWFDCDGKYVNGWCGCLWGVCSKGSWECITNGGYCGGCQSRALMYCFSVFSDIWRHFCEEGLFECCKLRRSCNDCCEELLYQCRAFHGCIVGWGYYNVECWKWGCYLMLRLGWKVIVCSWRFHVEWCCLHV